jgi:hypothetical protein
MTDLLDKDFKTSILNIIKEPKDDVDKLKKMMCEQNENINKKVENLKRDKK